MPNSTNLECPANYFGKGVHHQLSDNREEIAEYERRWAEWEAAHPDDPTGEIALAAWEKTNASVPVVSRPAPVHSAAVQAIAVSAETSPLELQLPDSDIQLLKNYAKHRRRRPRDIISELIRANCIIH